MRWLVPHSTAHNYHCQCQWSYRFFFCFRIMSSDLCVMSRGGMEESESPSSRETWCWWSCLPFFFLKQCPHNCWSTQLERTWCGILACTIDTPGHGTYFVLMLANISSCSRAISAASLSTDSSRSRSRSLSLLFLCFFPSLHLSDTATTLYLIQGTSK